MSWEQHMMNGAAAAKKGDVDGAEYAYLKAVKEAEKFPSNDPRLEQALSGLIEVYWTQDRQILAEPYLVRILEIISKRAGMNSMDVVVTLDRQSEVAYCLEDSKKAEALSRKVLHIQQSHLGPDHPDVATTLNKVAILSHTNGNYEQAESAYKQALITKTKLLGGDHPEVLSILQNYASVLQTLHRQAEAEHMMQCVTNAIQEKMVSEAH